MSALIHPDDYVAYVADAGSSIEREARILAVLDQLEARTEALHSLWRAYQRRTAWPQLSVYDVHIDRPAGR